MKRKNILNLFHNLANSQGYYGRLLNQIYSNPVWGDRFLDHLEKQNFKDSVDLILYLES